MSCIVLLRVSERIQFRLRELSYRCLHGQRHLILLRASTCHACHLLLPSTVRRQLDPRAIYSWRLSFFGKSFSSWNILPSSVKTAASMQVFLRELKKNLLFQLFLDQPFVYIGMLNGLVSEYSTQQYQTLSFVELLTDFIVFATYLLYSPEL